MASKRMVAMRACSFASLALALRRLADPFSLRDRPRESLRKRSSSALWAFGPGMGGFSRRERRQRRHAQIDTDRALVFGFGQVRTVGRVHGDADEPLVGHAGDGGRQDLAGEAQRLAHAHPAEIGDTHAGTVDVELVVGEGEAVVHALLAERRGTGTAGEEVLERLPKRDDGHLRRVLRDLQHPREPLALDRVQWPPQGVLRGLRSAVVGLPRLVLALPRGERPVVGEARRVPAARARYVACTWFGSSAMQWAISIATPPRRPSRRRAASGSCASGCRTAGRCTR